MFIYINHCDRNIVPHLYIQNIIIHIRIRIRIRISDYGANINL